MSDLGGVVTAVVIAGVIVGILRVSYRLILR